MQSKDDLRKLALAQRNALPEEERARQNRAICDKLFEFFCKKLRASSANGQVDGHIMRSDTDPNHQVELKGLNIALYEAINSEVNLSELALALSNSGEKVLKPIITKEEGAMEFTDWENAFDPRKTYDLHLWQPSLTLVKPEEIDIIVCPVVAFDREGNRLGYGRGYYDRYLPRLSPSTLKIGAAFACQEVKKIPSDPHDIPLDYVFTERWLP